MYDQNIKSLAIETYKAVNNLPGGHLSEFFIRNNHSYNLCSKSETKVPNIKYFLRMSKFYYLFSISNLELNSS